MDAAPAPRRRGRREGARELVRCVLLFAARRSSLGLLLALFLARAGRSGLFQRWLEQLATASEDWSLLCAIAICVLARVLQMPEGAWLALMLVVCSFGDVELLVAIFGWAAQLLGLVTEIVLSIADFVGCGLWIWSGLFRWGFSGALSRIAPTEWLAAALVQIWVLLAAYATLGVRLERWRAKSLLEAALRCALQRPFHAKFEHSEFVRQCSGTKDEIDEPALMKTGPVLRSISDQFLTNVEMLPEVELRQLEEKHTALLQARQALLEERLEFAALPDMLSLEVRRDRLLEDSWSALLSAADFELLAPRLQVSYAGELGVDAGGLSLDWFDAVGQELTADAEDDAGTSLFALGKSSRMLIPRPYPVGGRGPEEEASRCRELMLSGRFLALGVVHGGRPLRLPLSPLIGKYIMGRTVELADVDLLDPAFYRERVAPLLRPGGLAELESALGEPLVFESVPTELRPVPEELQPGGLNRIVTEDNLAEYLHLLCEAFLCSEIRQELQCMLQGFWDVLPLDALLESGITEKHLAALLAGTPGLDPSEWRRHSNEEPGSCQAAGQVITWFWSVVRMLDEEQRRRLLRFVTGSGRLPPGGFAALAPRFTVSVCTVGSREHLPHAHTCISRLVLPCYESKVQLQAKLLQALGTRGFGMA